MDIIEIMRLIVLVWPLIEQIIQMIEDETKRKEAEEVVAKAIGDMFKNVA